MKAMATASRLAKTAFATLGIASGLVAGGCSTSEIRVSNVFDDLTNESTSSGTLVLDYRSFLSISGLAPLRSLGMYVIHPSGFSPTHAFGISPKWSFFTVSDYPLKADDKVRLDGLVGKYQELQDSARDLAAKKMVVTGAATAIGAMEAAIANERADAASLGEALEVKARLAKELVSNESLDAAIKKGMAAVAESAAKKISDKSESDGDRYRRRACTVLRMNTCTLDGVKAASEQATRELDELTKRFYEQKSKFNKDANVENAIVMRWTKRVDDKAEGSYGQQAAAGYANQQGKTGIAIYGGLRVEALYFGEDFLDLLARYDGFWEKVAFTRSSIPLYQVMARHVEYISDEDQMSTASIRARVSPSQLKAIADAIGTVTDATNIGVELAHSFVADVGNKGRLNAPTVSVKPYCFFPPRIHQGYLAKALKDNDGFSSIYAVEAQVTLLASAISSLFGLPKTDLRHLLDNDKKIENGDRFRHKSEYLDQCSNGTIPLQDFLEQWKNDLASAASCAACCGNDTARKNHSLTESGRHGEQSATCKRDLAPDSDALAASAACCSIRIWNPFMPPLSDQLFKFE